MKKFLIIIISVVAILLLAKVFAGSNGGAKEDTKTTSLQSLEGKPAPNFVLTDRQGKQYTNESLKGKKVLLFFNEGLACYPACWEQMKQLSNDSRLNTDDIITLSVVTDTKESWQNATAKTSELAAIKVAFDEGSIASKAFGMTQAPSSMHGGVPGHTYVVIDKDGIVRYVLDDPRMGINNAKVYLKLNELQ
jgi:peroxiredoxin